MPDTKEINTFNLSAEAKLQNKIVDIRQIISNEKSIEDDLKRFNWFLIKDGYQGIMSNGAKVKLSELIKESNSFENFQSWELPDEPQATLFERKTLNESIEIIDYNFSPSKLDLVFNKNGLTISLKGNEKTFNNSYLLIDASSEKKNYEINIALPKIINLSSKNIHLMKNINFEDSIDIDESFAFNCYLII